MALARCIKRLGKEDDGSGYSAETAYILSEDALRRVYVFDEDFANRLLCFAENAKDNAVSGFADEMIEKAKILIEYQKLAKYGDM